MNANANDSALFRLKAAVQTYDWGKSGSASLVAQFARNAIDEEFEIDEEMHYAEIWMGTHPNGPAHLWSDPQSSLGGLIIASPQIYLGQELTTGTFTSPGKFPGSMQVPFLFKVLSIAKALPLQAHPDKRLAEQLHETNKEQFVDSNHKPEIAVALSDGFKAFVGFQEPGQIAQSLRTIPELKEAIGNDEIVQRFLSEENKESLKAVFSALLTADDDVVKRHVGRLVERFERLSSEATGGIKSQADMVLRLHKQYPYDVGVFAAPFFMNFVTLNKGDAVYIGADEAHAYLEGDIIECMAVSDNVLNAAFVPPSSRDTSTFLNSLTYTARSPSHWSLPRAAYKNSRTGKTTAFDPPLEEYTVLWTQLPAPLHPRKSITEGTKEASMAKDGIVQRDDFIKVDDGGKVGGGEEGMETLSGAVGPTIGIVTHGKVEFRQNSGNFESLTLGEGGVIFVKPHTDVSIQSIEGVGEVWWAACVE